MFKVKHTKRNEDIISLDPAWSSDELREWTRRDELVCPGCGAPVNYRREGVKRAHFAHRTLQGCDYADGDAAVIAARALLWSFFREKVGHTPGWKVDVEVPLPNGDLIDVWVQAPNRQPVAYKVFTKGRRLERYEDLKSQVDTTKAELRPILILARREWAEDVLPDVDHSLLMLPAADRNLKFWRPWDRYHILKLGTNPYPYDSICYVDHEAERLVLYRNLRRPGNCNPAVRDYEQAHEAPLKELLVWHGDIIFPEERDARAKWEQWSSEEEKRLAAEMRKAAEARRKAAEELALWQKREEELRANRAAIKAGASLVARVAPTEAARATSTSSRECLSCRYCGQVTWDWWERQGDQCSCNACRIRKRGEDPKICSRCQGAYAPNYPMKAGLCIPCRSQKDAAP